jgi:hypothetical protein
MSILTKEERDRNPRELLEEFKRHNARMQCENHQLRQEILTLQAQIRWLESKPRTLAYPLVY